MFGSLGRVKRDPLDLLLCVFRWNMGVIKIETLTQKVLKELVDYDCITGTMKWKWRSSKWFTPSEHKTSEHICAIWNSKYAGTTVGSLNKSTQTYRAKVLGKGYELSRLAYLYETGLSPTEVGHRNGNGLDNSFANLCEQTVIDNRRSRRPHKRNKTLIAGVCFHKRDQLWRAKIRHNGSEIGLGYHKSFFEACAARKSAENTYGYNKSHR